MKSVSLKDISSQGFLILSKKRSSSFATRILLKGVIQMFGPGFQGEHLFIAHIRNKLEIHTDYHNGETR